MFIILLQERGQTWYDGGCSQSSCSYIMCKVESEDSSYCFNVRLSHTVVVVIASDGDHDNDDDFVLFQLAKL